VDVVCLAVLYLLLGLQMGWRLGTGRKKGKMTETPKGLSWWKWSRAKERYSEKWMEMRTD
jgi:hypothetical protein